MGPMVTQNDESPKELTAQFRPVAFESKINDLKNKIDNIKTSISFEIEKQRELSNQRMESIH